MNERKHILILLLIITTNLFSQELFVTKRNYSDSSNYFHTLLGIDQTNGNTVNTINLSTNFSNSSQNADNSPESLVFNQATNEIIGIVGNIIVKFNIASNTETSFILPVITSSDYGDIIVAEQNSLSVENDNLILSKLIPKKAYNILGKEISLNTKNVLMIIEFENGSRKKIMKLK